jgi:hypothetical protein
MESEDFWRDDAAAVQQREAERATGLRMPKASDTRIVSPGVNDRRAVMRQRSPRVSRVVLLAVATAVAVVAVLYARSPGISLAQFDALQTGMSVAEARGVMGSDGAVVLDYHGPNDLIGFKDATNIQWVNRDGSNAVAGFIEGVLQFKVQVGLH